MTANLFLVLVAAAALNPLVVRTNEAQGNVPADCVTSGRPAVRVQIAQREPESETAAPLPAVRAASKPVATRDTEELRRALARNDRPAFDAALARAREASVPVRVYEDIARLWDAQFESPFFAEGSEPYRIAGGYPGYEAAVRRQVFTDAKGRKFYLAAESRAFVASQVGVGSKVAAPPSRPSVARKRTATPAKRVAAPKRAPVVVKRVEPPAQAPVTTTTEAPPATASSEPVPMTSTVTTTPDTVAPTTAAPDTSAAPDTTAPATTTSAPAAAKGRSIIFPAILILIGLGVLILLFRTAR